MHIFILIIIKLKKYNGSTVKINFILLVRNERISHDVSQEGILALKRNGPLFSVPTLLLSFLPSSSSPIYSFSRYHCTEILYENYFTALPPKWRRPLFQNQSFFQDQEHPTSLPSAGSTTPASLIWTTLLRPWPESRLRVPLQTLLVQS